MDPAPSSGEPSTASAALTLNENNYFSFNTVTIQHGPFGNSAQSAEWDELRVGTEYANVIAGAYYTDLATAADSFIRAGSYASSNYGSNGSLWVKNDASSDYDRMAILRFDLSSYSGSITNATLSLTPNTVGSSINNTELKAYLVSDDSWTETGVTWNNQPAYSTLLDTVSGTTIQNGVPVEFDVSAAAATEHAGDGELSILILSTTEGSQHYVVFDSYESGGDQPLLSIE